MTMGPGLDPTQMARVVAHGKRIEEQMRRIQDRFEVIRGTALRMQGASPTQPWDEVETYGQEGIVAVEELSRLMAMDPSEVMFGGGESQ